MWGLWGHGTVSSLSSPAPAQLAGILDGEGGARGASGARAGLGSLPAFASPSPSLLPSLPPLLTPPPEQTLTLSPSFSFPHPEFPYTPSPPEHGRRAGPVPTAIIGGVVGSILLVLIVVGGIVVALRRRRHAFKGDYSTKKHVYGNGYSKAGIPQHHPPMAQNLQYPEDSDDDKKAGPLGGSSYEEEEEIGRAHV